MRSRPSYSCARVNVGLVIVSMMPSPAPKPWAKAVLPAPRSPASRTRSPGRARSPSAAARAGVSSTVRVWATSAAARSAVTGPPPLARSPCRTPARAYRAATPRPVWRRSAARWVQEGVTVRAGVRREDRTGEAVVGALGDSVAGRLVQAGVGGDDADHGVPADGRPGGRAALGHGPVRHGRPRGCAGGPRLGRPAGAAAERRVEGDRRRVAA